jgi:hypothetical protein
VPPDELELELELEVEVEVELLLPEGPVEAPVVEALPRLVPLELVELTVVLPVPDPEEPEDDVEVDVAEARVELAVVVDPDAPLPEPVVVALPDVAQADSKQEPNPTQRNLVVNGRSYLSTIVVALVAGMV